MLQTESNKGQAEELTHSIQPVLDALSAHVSILDENGVIIAVNKAWRSFADENELHGSDYGVGINYLNVCDAATGHNAHEAHQVAQGIREVMQGKAHDFILEYPCHSPIKHRWFVMHVTRFEWDGNPCFVVAHQNVTELKKVQIELADSKKRTQAILDGVSNGILTINIQGIIESANPAAAEIFGYPLEEICGSPLTMLLVGYDNVIHTHHLLKQLVSSKDNELQGQRKNGAVFPMYMNVDRLYIGKKRVYSAIIQDITERKRMQAEIIENEKLNLALEKERELRDLKNRFIAMMSHEIRTPLASIQLSSDMLKVYGQKIPPEELDLYFDNITTQIGLLTELIRDVQAVNTGDSASTSVTLEPTDLVEYCRTIIQEFQLIHHTTHQIIFESDSPYIDTRLDRKVMRRVITNLITNAVKYSPDGGDVNVSISNGEQRAKIRVSDQGIGIPEEDMVRLFEPFHRASNVESLPGTGLGLTIAKQAIELHSGSINVKSVEGEGTRITLCLPVYGEQKGAFTEE